MQITNSLETANFLRLKIQCHDVEEFWAIALNPYCTIIHCSMLFRGTVDSCLVHPRDIFRFGIIFNASSIIVVHNHPSGNCFPSDADIKMSSKIKEAGLLLQIPLTDHVIITARTHYSFADSYWKRTLK